MLPHDNVPPVADTEILARFVTKKDEYRRHDNSVRPSLFMPYWRVDLSVTRHAQASEEEIWKAGDDVVEQINNSSSKQQRSLIGRADIHASTCTEVKLKVIAKPLSDNPNHADISEYPEVKADQKSIAQQLVAGLIKVVQAPQAS